MSLVSWFGLVEFKLWSYFFIRRRLRTDHQDGLCEWCDWWEIVDDWPFCEEFSWFWVVLIVYKEFGRWNARNCASRGDMRILHGFMNSYFRCWKNDLQMIWPVLGALVGRTLFLARYDMEEHFFRPSLSSWSKWTLHQGFIINTLGTSTHSGGRI